MSGHADTISTWKASHDALVAENQRLRDVIETAFWKASFDSPAWRVLRAAVDGTP